MAQRFTMVRLHDRLSDYKSYAVITSEQIGYRTTVHGAAATGAKATDDKTRRKARFDSLGEQKARRAKLQVLNGLIKRSGVWGKQGDDPYVIGLAQAVLLDRPPSLMVAYARKGFVCSRLALVESKPVFPEHFAPPASRVLTKSALVAHDTDADADANASEPGPESCSTAPAKRVIAASEADSDDLASLVASDDGEALVVVEGLEPDGLELDGEDGHGEDGHGPPRKVTKADAPPSVRGSRFTRGYAIPQDLLGRASFKEFLASSNNDKPDGLTEWKAARKDYEESEQAKQDLAEAKAQAEREGEAERERKKEEREAKHEAERARLAENQEGRDFHNEIKYGAEVEKRQRLGGFTAAPVTSA